MPDYGDPAQTFKEFDADGDGYITRAEFKQAMNARGEDITDAEIGSIFRGADQHDGDIDDRISLQEFITAWNR